jgi:hypothetical protein
MLRDLKEILIIILIFGGVFVCPVWAQDSGVDGLLSGVASGLEERAQQVAAQVIQSKLTADLCGGKTVILNPNDKTNAVTLTIGCSSNDCADNPTVYFGASCRLLEDPSVNIADTTVLTTICSDLVKFLFRLSLSSMKESDYEKMNINSIADFSYQAIQNIVNKGNVHDLAAPLESLANTVDSQYVGEYLTEVTGFPETAALIQALQTSMPDQSKTFFTTIPGDWNSANGAAAIKTIFNTDFSPTGKYYAALNQTLADAKIPAAQLNNCAEEKNVSKPIGTTSKINICNLWFFL